MFHPRQPGLPNERAEFRGFWVVERTVAGPPSAAVSKMIWVTRPGHCRQRLGPLVGGCARGTRRRRKNFRNYLQLFWEWLKLQRLLDNLSFRGMENLQVNVVQ
jgi:hypothetical protein